MMGGQRYPGNRRTDGQLEAIVYETAEWTVTGRNGRALCTAPSLRRALDKAANFAASGTIVVAMWRLQPDNIIVFEAQATRLREHRAGREAPLFRDAVTPTA